MKPYVCQHCGFDLWVPIAHWNITSIGLYDDARFPGRLIVALRDHHEQFDELGLGVSAQYIREVQRASRVLRQVTAAARVNLAILGNAVPHVHTHLIPRYPHQETKPHSSPWDDPRPRAKMSEQMRQQWVTDLRDAFTDVVK